MMRTQINLAFMRSLGEDWKVFNHALGDKVNVMKPAELYAQVQAYDDTENISRPTFSVKRPNPILDVLRPQLWDFA